MPLALAIVTRCSVLQGRTAVAICAQCGVRRVARRGLAAANVDDEVFAPEWGLPTPAGLANLLRRVRSAGRDDLRANRADAATRTPWSSELTRRATVDAVRRVNGNDSRITQCGHDHALQTQVGLHHSSCIFLSCRLFNFSAFPLSSVGTPSARRSLSTSTRPCSFTSSSDLRRSSTSLFLRSRSSTARCDEARGFGHQVGIMRSSDDHHAVIRWSSGRHWVVIEWAWDDHHRWASPTSRSWRRPRGCTRARAVRA